MSTALPFRRPFGDLPLPADRMQRSALIRLAASLLAEKKRAAHNDHGFDTFREYAAHLGYRGGAYRDLLDLGRVVAAFPRLDAELIKGRVSFGIALELSVLVARPGSIAFPPGATEPVSPDGVAASAWVRAARRTSHWDLRNHVSAAVDRARMWPERPQYREVELTPTQRADMERAYALACDIHERRLTPGEFFKIAYQHYLDAHPD